ncbi:MAG: helix-turn-helix transcriptional regulator [Oscillibacter sp.]|nr:helix-turn-helix transcriptional regulator [Oscillibacter sp.]
MRDNIEAERGRMRMTKCALCEALGVTLKTYNGYINGAPIPSTILEKLHRMTGKSVDYLLGLRDTPAS